MIMGEMADYSLDLMWDAPINEYTCEPVEDWNPWWSRQKPAKPHGPGKCPCCGGETVKRVNRYTGSEFYGCKRFPECRGTRNG